MIYSLEGAQGCGKSLTATAIAFKELTENGRKIISNNHMKFPYTHFDPAFFMEHLEDDTLENCVLLLDEAYLYLDGRTSASKFNKLFTYFVVQTRKRGVDLYICTHHIDIVDKRLRRAVDVRGTCRSRIENPCQQCGGNGEDSRGFCATCTGEGAVNSEGVDIVCSDCNGSGKGNTCKRCLGYGVTGWVTTTFRNVRHGKRIRLRIFGPAYWDLYSTIERVPFLKKQMKIDMGELM